MTTTPGQRSATTGCIGVDGDDKLWGGPNADRIFGDDGDDDGSGQSGNDPEVRGGPGADKLWGNGGDDTPLR